MLSEDKHLAALLRKEGDIESCVNAFEQLYRKHHASMYRVAVKFVKSEELAAEIVQEVFVKLWEYRRNLDENRDPAAYLYTMARNHIFNMLQRSSRESRVKEEIRLQAEISSNATESRVLLSEYRAVINSAIQELPPRRRRIFLMCRQEGKSYEEVAGTFGISKSTVRDHMVKALKSLRRHLLLKAGVSVSFFGYLLFFY